MIYDTNEARQGAIEAIDYHLYMLLETNETPEYDDVKELASLLRNFRRALADEMKGATNE